MLKEQKSGPSFLSLFSGCGGFDLGFMAAGYQPIGSIDIDRVALDVHERNLSTPIFEADLSKSVLPAGCPTYFDVLLAGSPCQGFSTIGQRRVDDPRNALLLVAAKIAKKYGPKVVVAENVPAVASGAHKKYWDQLHQHLRSSGYDTAEMKCNAADYGVPQIRKRLFLVAWKPDVELDLTVPFRPQVSLGEALFGVGGLPNHEKRVLVEGTDDHFISLTIAQGQKLSNVRSGPRSVHYWDIPSVFGKTTTKERDALNQIIRLRRRNRVREVGDADPVGSEVLIEMFGQRLVERLVAKGFLKKIGCCHDLVGTFNGKFRRAKLDGLSNTVDTRFGDARYALHPLEHRGYTVREAARIQGFPDSFVFSGRMQEQFRMIGNAVPPPMSEALAEHFFAAIEAAR